MNFKRLVFFFAFIFTLGLCNAQVTTNKKPTFCQVAFKDTTQADVMDVLKTVFNSKKNKQVKPIKNFQAAVLPAIGYSLQTGFAAVITGNAGFSVNRKDTNQKLSTVISGFTYSQRQQIIFPLIFNIWTKNNKFNIISDNRYINYPDYIFGVGNSINKEIKYNCAFSSLRFHESILTQVAKNSSVGIGLFYDQIWNIDGFDSIYPIINPLSTNTIKKEIASGVGIRFLYDSRLNQINPTKGFLANFVYRQNTTMLGSDYNWIYAILDTRAYIPFPRNSKNILAFWNLNWMSFGNNITNFLLPSNGWDDIHNTGRGYIQGRFRSKNMFALDSEYRFRLTKNGLFGATVFANAIHYNQEYFYNENKVKLGYGVGLRIKFNKHSQSNLCIDYAFGQNGSHGFFVNIGEVF